MNLNLTMKKLVNNLRIDISNLCCFPKITLIVFAFVFMLRYYNNELFGQIVNFL